MTRADAQIAYLDYNATAPVLPAVVEAMRCVWQLPVNASSVHGFGRKGKQMLREARKDIAKAIGAQGAEIIFTSGGTEANNHSVKAIESIDVVMHSSIEHVSLHNPVKEMTESGIVKAPYVIPVTGDGVVDVGALSEKLKELKDSQEITAQKFLVSVMLVNNETGVIQPVAEIAQAVYQCGGFMHCDASQAIGKIPVDFTELNVDMMTISAHKAGGPQGVGALVVKRGLHIKPLHFGGGQERGYRAGTENIAGICGFAEALKQIRFPNIVLQKYLEEEIKQYAPDAIIAGEGAQRIPNTSCIILNGMSSELQLMTFDLGGVAVSSGSACSSGKVATSHVLLAMGYSEDLARSSIRVSYGERTTEEEIQKFIRLWKKNYDKARCNIMQDIPA